MTPQPSKLAVRRLARPVLGKMLQTTASCSHDLEAPYLRAAHVQPGGLIADPGVKEMWFSPSELVSYDLRAGDVVVVEGGAGFGRSACLRMPMPGWGYQNSIVRLRPRPGVADGRFISYALQHGLAAGEIALVCNTATIPHFTAEKVAAFELAYLPYEDQRRVATFLDYETAKIDSLIAKQKQLIARAEERKRSLVDTLVWNGLDRAELAGTGIDPAPEAPAHWKRARNRQLLSERTGLSLTGNEVMLTVSHITGVTPRSEKNVTMFEAESTVGYRLVSPGDLAINTMWAWMGALGVSKDEGIVSPAYGVYTFHEDVDVRYFEYLYRSRPYIAEMTRHSRGIWSSRLRLYPASFLRLGVVVPPREEQTRIADHLDDKLSKLDALIAKTQRFIELSKERRAALIADAVTGQIDVQGEVA